MARWIPVWIAALALVFGTGGAQAQTTETVGTTSGVLTTTVTITTAGISAATTAAALPVLTQGIAGLDFNLAGGGSCAANISYTAGQTCTVNYTFTPSHPWVRYGGIEVVTSSGTVLGNSFVHGIGNGPQAAFSLSTSTMPVTLLGSGLHQPTGIAVDAGGNIFIADLNSNTVYEILAAGGYTTINTLGGGFNGPSTVAIDGSGNIYIANANDETVSEMPPGCVSASCVVTLGGGFTRPSGVAIDVNGNVYVADYNNQAVTEMPPNCYSTICMTKLGGGFSNPREVAVDGNGYVYVVDPVNVALTRMPPGCLNVNCVVTLGGGFNYPQGVAVDGAGNAYVSDQNDSAVKEISPTCMSASCVVTLGGNFSLPVGVALDSNENIYVINQFYQSVQKIDVQDPPSLSYAGTPAGSSSAPQVVTFSNNGNLPLTISALAATNADLAPGTTCDTSTALAAGTGCTMSIDFIPATQGSLLTGSVSVTDNTLYDDPNITQTIGLSGSGLGSGSTAQTISFPAPASPVEYGVAPIALAATATSTLPISYAITGPATVSGSTLTITGAGTVTIVASQYGDSTYAPATPVTQSIFVSSGPIINVGTSSGTLTATMLFSSTGTLNSTLPIAIQVVTQGATGLDFNYVSGGTCVPNLTYVPAQTCTVKYTFTPTRPWMRYGGIQLLNSAGVAVSNTYLSGLGNSAQTTFALGTPAVPISLGSGFILPWGMAVDADGNVYVGDSGHIVVNTGPGVGSVYEILAAGGYTTIKTLGGVYAYPDGLAVDGIGNVYVTDSGNSTVREIPPGCLNSSCVVQLGGDFYAPLGIVVDQSGNVYVADVAATITEMPPNCFSTSCMTILGGGFARPYGVAVDAGGNVYVADHNSNVVSVMPAGCASASCVTPLGGGFSALDGIAVDGSGNVYVDEPGHVTKMPPGCFTADCVTTLDSGFTYPLGIAVDGSGNIFFADSNDATVHKIDVEDPPSLTFGGTPIGGISAPQLVTLGNNGNLPLNLSALALTDASLGTNTTCATSSAVASGAACSLDIEFAPTTLGSSTGSTSITDNDLFNSSTIQIIHLTGSGMQQTPTLMLASVATVAYGDSSLLSVSLAWTGNGPVPTGAVTFSVDSGAALTATCAGGATPIVCTYTGVFATGTHTLNASYAGDANYTAASATQSSFSVGLQSPTLTLGAVTTAAYPNASTLSVSLTWTGTSAAPTGAVTFSVDSGSALTATCVGSTSPITCTYTGSFAAGTHMLNASSAADINYAAASATPSSFSVNKQAPTLTLSAVTTVTYPSNSTLSVSLAWTGSGTGPTGAVTFSVDGSSALTATCVGSATPIICTYTGSFAAGTHTLNASYAGSSNYAAASATPINFSVSLQSPTLTLSAVTTVTYPSNSVLSVSLAWTGAGAAPTGAVTFSVDGGSALTASCVGTTTPITCTYTGSFAAGTHTLNASYAASSNYAGASATAESFTVLAAATKLVFGSSPTSPVSVGSNGGSAVTVLEETSLNTTATTATDPITLTVTGPAGFGTKIYGPTAAIAGVATFNVSASTLTVAGNYTYTATFGSLTSAVYTEVVVTGISAATIISSINLTQNHSTTALTPVTGSGGVGALTYSVLPALPAGLSFSTTGVITGTPTAVSAATIYTVTVTDTSSATATATFTLAVDSAVVATQAVATTNLIVNVATAAFTPVTGSGGFGSLSYTVLPPLPAGLSFSSSTGTITGTPTAKSPTTTYTVTVTDANQASAANNFTLTVSAGTPTIVFTVPNHNYGDPPFTVSATSNSTGAFTYSVVSGLATISGSTVTLTGAGLVTLKASEAADANYNAATKDATFTVSTSSLTITANNANRLYGAANPTFTGSVLGTLPGDTLVESFNTSATTLSPVGAYSIVPSVTGADVSSYTQDVIDGTLTIAQAPTSITLSANATSVASGQSVTFTVQVVPSTSGTPTGTVILLDNGGPLATLTLSGGSATYAVTNLAPGITHVLTATYGGDSNFLGTTASSNPAGTATIAVTGTDSALIITSGPAFTVNAGAALNFDLLLTPLPGAYPGAVTFTISGLPPGATITFNPASLSSVPSPTLVPVTIQTAASTAKLLGLPGNMEAIALGLLLLPIGYIRRVRKQLTKPWLLLILLGGILSGGFIMGCGGRSKTTAPASQTYTLVVTATSDSVTHTATATLTIP